MASLGTICPKPENTAKSLATSVFSVVYMSNVGHSTARPATSVHAISPFTTLRNVVGLTVTTLCAVVIPCPRSRASDMMMNDFRTHPRRGRESYLPSS